MTRKAEAQWMGDLKNGNGNFKTESGLVKGEYTFASRFQDNGGTNPEELIAAAHAACYSMALSNLLDKEGHKPASVKTQALVTIEKSDVGFIISGIELICRADVPGIQPSLFDEKSLEAKEGCPVSIALKNVPIKLKAFLENK